MLKSQIHKPPGRLYRFRFEIAFAAFLAVLGVGISANRPASQPHEEHAIESTRSSGENNKSNVALTFPGGDNHFNSGGSTDIAGTLDTTGPALFVTTSGAPTNTIVCPPGPIGHCDDYDYRSPYRGVNEPGQHYEDVRLIHDYRSASACRARVLGTGTNGDIELGHDGGACRLVFGYTIGDHRSCTFNLGLVNPATIGDVDGTGFYFSFPNSSAPRHLQFSCANDLGK